MKPASRRSLFRRAALLALALLAAAPAGAAPLVRRLIWSDEFNGDKLDLRCWTPETTRPGNNWDEMQRFTASPKNLGVHNGALWIQALKETTGVGADTRDYTAAQITTANNAYWTYGYYEARIKAPAGPGSFPAFWMMPQFSEWGGWPNSGEIDIWEYIGRDANIAYSALHFKGDDWHGGIMKLPGPLYDRYHVYGFEWLPRRMRWFVDGKLMWEKTTWISPDPRRPRAPFDTPFYLILNMAIGGKWPHPPTDATRYPLNLAVDYVRVYSIDGVKDPRPRRAPPGADARACPAHGPGGASPGPVNLRETPAPAKGLPPQSRSPRPRA
jgi:beta-glucanase (GH16 family)